MKTEVIRMKGVASVITIDDGKDKRNGYKRRFSKEEKEKRKDELRELIKRTVIKDGGRFVSFSPEKYGLLVAGVEQNGKLFFAVMNKDRNIEYVPMRETYKLMKEIPVDLSVLEFLLRQQSSTVIEMATESFNKDKYELITEIGICVYKHKKNMTEYRTKKKFQKK
jgi:hypothetical protein